MSSVLGSEAPRAIPAGQGFYCNLGLQALSGAQQDTVLAQKFVCLCPSICAVGAWPACKRDSGQPRQPWLTEAGWSQRRVMWPIEGDGFLWSRRQRPVSGLWELVSHLWHGAAPQPEACPQP